MAQTLRHLLRMLYGFLRFYSEVIKIHIVVFFRLLLTFEVLKATTLPWFATGQNVVYFLILSDNSAACKVDNVFWT
tara:strand:- start:857 stop:1084 length:228 start_codon:yes stop_codon:yes gene_type:complete